MLLVQAVDWGGLGMTGDDRTPSPCFSPPNDIMSCHCGLSKMVPVTFRCLIFLCKGGGDILSDQYKSNRGPSFLPRLNIECAT